MFVGSRAGGRRAAILFSLVASAKANQVEPWGVAPRCIHAPAGVRRERSSRPIEGDRRPPRIPWTRLLPDRWLAANPSHRWDIDALRRRERQRSQPLRDKKRRR